MTDPAPVTTTYTVDALFDGRVQLTIQVDGDPVARTHTFPAAHAERLGLLLINRAYASRTNPTPPTATP